MNKIHKAAILSIGDELLIGQVINTNASWLSAQLSLVGLTITKHLSVADDGDSINNGLAELSAAADVILVTGGLGPTKDDITISAIARYFDDKLVFHAPTFDRLNKIMERFGRSVNEDQRHQCELPSKAHILPNDLGTAPCMYVKETGRHYFFMPGVPFEMKHLFEDRVMPILKEENLLSTEIITKTILTAGIGESHLEQQIEDIVATFPKGLSIAYLPGKAQVRVRLTGHSLPVETMNEFTYAIVARLGIGVFGYDYETLESAVGQLMIEQKLTLGCAESCTGGAISAKITSVPGASRYFYGSVISYANEVKIKLLNVSSGTLDAHGAVSEECVKEMIRGALQSLDVDVAIAISGIAGPGGGSEEKPVGTAYVGVGDKHGIKVKRLASTKSRSVNIEYFTTYALNMLRLFLMENERRAN